MIIDDFHKWRNDMMLCDLISIDYTFYWTTRNAIVKTWYVKVTWHFIRIWLIECRWFIYVRNYVDNLNVLQKWCLQILINHMRKFHASFSLFSYSLQRWKEITVVHRKREMPRLTVLFEKTFSYRRSSMRPTNWTQFYSTSSTA